LYPVIELKNLVAILRVILYEGGICSVALRDRELRGIFGRARYELTLEWKLWLHDGSVGALVIEKSL
jgi:hypothetical protein